MTTLLLTSKGLGVLDFLTIGRANTIMKGYYASELLYVSSLCFSKLSIVVLFYNVVVLRTHRIFVMSFGVCIFTWSLASVAASAFQCSLPRPWEMMTLRCFNTVGATPASLVLTVADRNSESSGSCTAQLTCRQSCLSSCSLWT